MGSGSGEAVGWGSEGMGVGSGSEGAGVGSGSDGAGVGSGVGSVEGSGAADSVGDGSGVGSSAKAAVGPKMYVTKTNSWSSTSAGRLARRWAPGNMIPSISPHK